MGLRPCALVCSHSSTLKLSDSFSSATTSLLVVCSCWFSRSNGELMGFAIIDNDESKGNPALYRIITLNFSKIWLAVLQLYDGMSFIDQLIFKYRVGLFNVTKPTFFAGQA